MSRIIMLLYSLKKVSLIYGKDNNQVCAVNNVSLQIESGAIVSIVGKSGAGKSSLLNLLGGLERPTSGELIFNKENIANYSERNLSRFRLENIGTVFQGCYLVSTMTVKDNILLPSIAASGKADEAYYNSLIERLNISNRQNHLPSQLSGGEKQRVAIARALMNKPKVILADEPTGNLDSVNSNNVFELLISCSKEAKSTLIYVTHDEKMAALAQQIIHIKDGKIDE